MDITLDPKQIALQFNEYINEQYIQGLTGLMTEDRRFIDRSGMVVSGKASMTRAWVRLFK
jgi:ketosteroid isomerase-like protein